MRLLQSFGISATLLLFLAAATTAEGGAGRYQYRPPSNTRKIDGGGGAASFYNLAGYPSSSFQKADDDSEDVTTAADSDETTTAPPKKEYESGQPSQGIHKDGSGALYGIGIIVGLLAAIVISISVLGFFITFFNVNGTVPGRRSLFDRFVDGLTAERIEEWTLLAYKGIQKGMEMYQAD